MTAHMSLRDMNDSVFFFNWRDSLLPTNVGCVYLASDATRDIDGDFLPDEWKFRNFVNLDNDGNGDFDSDGLSDAEEATTGAFVQYVPDGTNRLFSAQWTNMLVDVSFSCEPSNLPQEEMLQIAKIGCGELYEVLPDDSLSLIVATNYPANGIRNRRFKLHGHAPSANFKAEAISVTHLSSGAADEAPYTVLGRPKLVPDYDRDRKIDIFDLAIYDGNQLPFRFWINDDEDRKSTEGKYAESSDIDIPGALDGWSVRPWGL